MSVGCERLVHPSVQDAGEHSRQRRFIGVMLASPFFIAGAAVTLIAAGMGAAVTVAAIFAAFGLCWFTALLVAASASTKAAAPLALIVAGAVSALLIAAGGGFASPVALMVLALPFEAFWIAGTRKAAFWGAAGALGAVLLQPVAAALLPPGSGVSAWNWLLPLAWAATIALRHNGLRAMAAMQDAPESAPLLEDMLDAVVFRTGRQGEVLDVSEKARSILNLAPELLAGSGLFDRIHLSDRVSYLSALADLREGAVLRKLDLRIRLPQAGSAGIVGNYRRFSLELMRAQNEDGVFIALLREGGVVADLREELDRANEAAASAEIAKGRFLAAVSHELRTPLNAILGFSDMLLHEMFGSFNDPRQKEYVGLVRDSGQHLLDVVNSILDVSKIECGAYTTEPEPFRFIEAVEMCRSMMQLQAQAKTISLATQMTPDLGEINADRRAVQQILINLVSNAIKFTHDGGDVVIGANKIGSRLHFWVSDTGIGIAEENIASLGKPFMQIQNGYTRAFEGAGLGLSLVKGLVALHDGTMSVESAPGEGTKVTISLPIDGPIERPEKSAVVPMTARKTKEDGNGSLRKTA
ncbi:MAG TPA: PAS domain-containing sensor histidine kinase [Mesorhizobium sp.]